MMESHNRKTGGRDIPEAHADPVSGLSWQFLCMVAMRGDLKGRKKGTLIDRAQKEMARRGMTLEQALAEVGR